jgi:hypothetical protein
MRARGPSRVSPCTWHRVHGKHEPLERISSERGFVEVCALLVLAVAVSDPRRVQDSTNSSRSGPPSVSRAWNRKPCSLLPSELRILVTSCWTSPSSSVLSSQQLDAFSPGLYFFPYVPKAGGLPKTQKPPLFTILPTRGLLGNMYTEICTQPSHLRVRCAS